MKRSYNDTIEEKDEEEAGGHLTSTYYPVHVLPLLNLTAGDERIQAVAIVGDMRDLVCRFLGS